MSSLASLDVGLPLERVRALVQRVLEEDAPWGDVTTTTFVAASIYATAALVARESGVLAGLPVAELVFRELDPNVCFVGRRNDGERIEAGSVLADVCGPAGAILTGERTALNLLQRMSGIATATAAYVAEIAGTGATIVDTRKTAPGLRLLDKYAVRCGGGSNHRFSLSDGMLVKDNHLAAVGAAQVGGARALLRRARGLLPHTIRMEVEVDRLDQIEDVLAGGADIVLLDNMGPAELRQAVALIAGRAVTEASGGITVETVRAVAETGVDLISVGALTHSVRALDIGLDVTLQGNRVPA